MFLSMCSLLTSRARGPDVHRVRPAWALILLLAGLTGLVPATFGGVRSSTARRTARTASQLKSVKSEIERVTREVTEDELKRDRLARDLRSAEEAVGHARQGLEDVQNERASGAARRAQLLRDRQDREAELARHRAILMDQMRAAYVLGREEPLRLLLNQQDPSLAQRLMVYYSYFGRARARQIQLVQGEVQQLSALAGELQAEDQQLAGLEQRQRTQLASLEQARAQRSEVLAKLDIESRSRELRLARLRTQQAGLQQLLHELREAMARLPPEGHEAFARLRGKLPWPVSDAQVLARFGETRAGAIKWDGLLLGTQLGEPVRAVYQGRIIYADWLPGLGLLTIIDHGGGYMSLYGHNQQLYKGVGAEVSTGEAIAAAGDTGGSQRPELYFGIRKGGKPVDPRPWFRTHNP